MLLLLGLGTLFSLTRASARLASSPTPILPLPFSTGPAPTATYSVGTVTLDYVVGVSTYEDVETYTDYGTSAYDTSLPTVTDPCGPKVQDPYTPPTCNTNDTSSPDSVDAFGYDASYVYQADTPAAYGVQCLNSTTDGASINTKNCRVTTVDICNKIRSTYSPRNKWVWSDLGGPGCAMAYWLPAANGSAPPPLKDRCEQGIFGTMVDLCMAEPDGYLGVSNIAGVNLIHLPGTNGTGQQVNAGKLPLLDLYSAASLWLLDPYAVRYLGLMVTHAGYPSYLVAPARMP